MLKLTSNKLSDRWLLIPIIGSLIILILKLISFSKIIYNSNFHIVNYGDMALHAPFLFFLDKYGFHNIVPTWHEGFKLFSIYPPGWHFFTLPIYKLVAEINLTSYLSYILMLIIGLIAVYFLGKYRNFSKIQTIAFFTFFFINPITVDYIFAGGRFPEFFAWVMFISLLAVLSFYQSKTPTKTSFIVLALILSILILSHPYVSLLGLGLTVLTFLITKKKHILLAILLAIILTSFWWIPFLHSWITYPPDLPQLTDYQTGELLSSSSILSFNTITLLSWLAIFFLYWRNARRSFNEKIFYYPLLIFSLLILFRIIPFIPILNQIPPNSINLFFIAMTLLTFFKIKQFPIQIKKIIIMIIILFPLMSSLTIFELRPQESYGFTQNEIRIIEHLPEIKGKYAFIDQLDPNRPPKGLTGYISLHYDLSTPAGGYFALTPREVYNLFIELNKSLKENNCELLIENLNNFKITTVISEDNCEFLSQCNFEEIYSNGACLFSIEDEKDN